jgi:CheY-like chemotaxis protein
MKRILVIEDDLAQRQLFKTVLKNAGYEVVEASDGQSGLCLYQEHPCDLIITDIFMPNEDGINTIFELKTRYTHVKIIAISGGGSWTDYGDISGAAEALETATRFGADRTLKKPIEIRQLLATVDELLGLKGRLYSIYAEDF